MALKTKPQFRGSGTSSCDSRSETQPFSDNDLFHLLQTSRRREAISYLLNTDGSARMRKVAEYVAATEHETSPTELTTAQYQRVYIPLYQSHLPKLDEYGVIEYDKSRGLVRPTDRLEIFRPYLDLASSTDTNVQPAGDSKTSSESDVDSYIAAAALSGLLLSVAVMELLLLPGVIIGGITITLFLLVTAATER